MDEEQKKEIKKAAWKKIPLKYKLIIFGIGLGFSFIVIFLVAMIAPLMQLGIIDINDKSKSTGGLSYSTIEASSGYWWPIGDGNPTEKDGKLFASGQPSCKVILSEDNGLDIASSTGKENTDYVIAVYDGVVIYPTSSDRTDYPTGFDGSDDGGGFGNYVAIRHNDGTITYYCHLYENTITVTAGDEVKQGQVLGKIGSSGSSSEPHLHFEVRVNGEKVNPLNYVSKDNPRPAGKYYISSIDGTGGTASENKSIICNTLLSSGYSENAVAGMMVNLAEEGQFMPNNMENSYENSGRFGTDEKYTSGVDDGSYTKDNFINDSIGYGLAQWTYYTRKEKLYNSAKSNNKSIADMEIQLNYLFSEISTGYLPTAEAISDETRSAESIAQTFCENFENPATSCTARAAGTPSFLAYVKNGCK